MLQQIIEYWEVMHSTWAGLLRVSEQELNGSVHAFKAAQMFIPSKVAENNPTSATVDLLKSFTFLDNVTIPDALKAELSIYISKAADDILHQTQWQSL